MLKYMDENEIDILNPKLTLNHTFYKLVESVRLCVNSQANFLTCQDALGRANVERIWYGLYSPAGRASYVLAVRACPILLIERHIR